MQYNSSTHRYKLLAYYLASLELMMMVTVMTVNEMIGMMVMMMMMLRVMMAG